MKRLLFSLVIASLLVSSGAQVKADGDEEAKIEFFVIHEAEFAGSKPIEIENLGVDGFCAVEPDMVVDSLDVVDVAGEEPPSLVIKLNKEGREGFAKMTGASIGKKILVVVCGEPITAPVVMDKIAGGTTMITTSKPEEIKELEKVLREMVKD